MKNLLNLGKALNKAEQKSINGGSLGGGCAIRINGSVWTGVSRGRIDNVIASMSEGDSVQWCCASCDSASWMQ